MTFPVSSLELASPPVRMTASIRPVKQANSKLLTGKVMEYLHSLCRVVVIPGENEMEALALGGLRILRGEEDVHQFHPVCPITQGN